MIAFGYSIKFTRACCKLQFFVTFIVEVSQLYEKTCDCLSSQAFERPV